jgi:hypothetical protein
MSLYGGALWGARMFGAALLALDCTSAQAQVALSRFGLVTGRVLTYVGTAQWTDTAQRVHSAPVQWRTKVVQVRSSRDARAALVRGWVQDLAWYTPGQRAALSVLLEYRGALYQLPIRDSLTAVDTLLAAVRDTTPGTRRFRLVIDSGLVVGRAFGHDRDNRDGRDGLYAWLVESETAVADRPLWLPLATEPTRWRLAYRTAPDHQLLDFVPGVGIARYVYAHHGTAASIDVHLSTVTSPRR